MGVILPIAGPILEGPPAQNPYCCIANLELASRGPRRRRRGLPFQPYLHTRISRITVVEQLPQIIQKSANATTATAATKQQQQGMQSGAKV